MILKNPTNLLLKSLHQQYGVHKRQSKNVRIRVGKLEIPKSRKHQVLIFLFLSRENNSL